MSMSPSSSERGNKVSVVGDNNQCQGIEHHHVLEFLRPESGLETAVLCSRRRSAEADGSPGSARDRAGA